MTSRTLMVSAGVWLVSCSLPATAQQISPASSASLSSAALTVVQAGPTGEIASLVEANEIRIVFSEPMVVLGRIPNPVTAPFVTIRPSISGTFRWSGTTILIFTPDQSRKLPFATEYEVSIDPTVTAVSGRRLVAPYRFVFTTPTVKLLGLDWYRKDKRYDSPMILALRLNQPVRAADILLHTTVRFERHEFDKPALTAEAQARLKTNDPQAIPRFQAKVATATAAATADSQLRFTAAADWDRKRFPAAPNLVIIEVTDPTPPVC